MNFGANYMKILQFFRTRMVESEWYFFRNKSFMLDEMAKFDAFYRVISSSKKPLISEYIVLIVGLWKKKHWCCPFNRDTRVQIFQIPNKVLCCHVRFHFRFIDPSECWDLSSEFKCWVELSVCRFGFFGGFEWVFFVL